MKLNFNKLYLKYWVGRARANIQPLSKGGRTGQEWGRWIGILPVTIPICSISQTNFMNKETKRKHKTQQGKDLQQPIHINHTSLQRQNNKTTCISPTTRAIFPLMRSIAGLQRVQLSWEQTIETLLSTSAALTSFLMHLDYTLSIV